MTTWFKTLDARDRKHLLCCLHDVRSAQTHSSHLQSLVVGLLGHLEAEHEDAKRVEREAPTTARTMWHRLASGAK